MLFVMSVRDPGVYRGHRAVQRVRGWHTYSNMKAGSCWTFDLTRKTRDYSEHSLADS